jgi:hypothetical protein
LPHKDDRNFIPRMLYTNIYWLSGAPSQIMCPPARISAMSRPFGVHFHRYQFHFSFNTITKNIEYSNVAFMIAYILYLPIISIVLTETL